jgi:hypothetical protein
MLPIFFPMRELYAVFAACALLSRAPPKSAARRLSVDRNIEKAQLCSIGKHPKHNTSLLQGT